MLWRLSPEVSNTLLHIMGKQPGQSLGVTGTTGHSQSHLFYVMKHTFNLCLLINTGAEINLIPLSRNMHKHSQEGFSLLAANGTPIPTYVSLSPTFNLGLHCTFQWIFVIADVKQAIIEANFLNLFNLLVDLKHK